MNFEEATEKVKTLSLSNEQLLKLYGLYKVATVGKCTISKPSYFDYQGRLKYDAWNSIEMDSESAKHEYVAFVLSLLPTQSQHQSQQIQTKSTGVKVSTIIQEPITEKTIFDYVKEGIIDKIKEILQEEHALIIDHQGMSLLHWSADRGHLEITKMLIDINSDVDLKDNEGNTPLHYAAISGHFDVFELLKERGDLFVKNNDGEMPIDFV